MLTAAYGVPASKINLGVAFYGRSQKGATALHGPTDCLADTSTFHDDMGAPQYYSIMDTISLFDQYWDNTAKVPYLMGKALSSAAGTFVSYDNKKSVGIKAQYIVNNNARGAIIWDMTGDYLETYPGSGVVAGTPLADTLSQGLCNSTAAVYDATLLDNTITLFPNPSNEQVTISTNIELPGTYQLKIMDMLGKEVKIGTYTLNKGSNKLSFEVNNVSNGYYFVGLENKTSTTRAPFIIHH